MGEAGAEVSSGKKRSPRILLSTSPIPSTLMHHFIQSSQGLCELDTIFIPLLGPRRLRTLVPGHTGCGYKRWSQAVWLTPKARPPGHPALDLVQARGDALGHAQGRSWWAKEPSDIEPGAARHGGSWRVCGSAPCPAPRARLPLPPSQALPSLADREQICCCCQWGLIHLRRLCFSSHALHPLHSGLAKLGV